MGVSRNKLEPTKSNETVSLNYHLQCRFLQEPWCECSWEPWCKCSWEPQCCYASGPGLRRNQGRSRSSVKELHTWPLPQSKVSQLIGNNEHTRPQHLMSCTDLQSVMTAPSRLPLESCTNFPCDQS